MTWYEITLPEVFAGFGPPQLKRSRSKAWGKLREEFRSDNQIAIPSKQFAPNRCVKDTVAYRVLKKGSLERACGPKEPGCVVVGLESPHASEFKASGDHFGDAIAPLQEAGSRAGLDLRLPSLLEEAAEFADVDLRGRQIVLSNSIQYQTSLQSLMGDEVNNLQRPVRNSVWHALWRAGGREDFEARLDKLKPSLILMAPTAPVKAAVAAFLQTQNEVPWIFAGPHPCMWQRQLPELSEDPAFRHLPSPIDPDREAGV